MRIGQYFRKIWTKLCGLRFLGHPVYYCNFGRRQKTVIGSLQSIEFRLIRGLGAKVTYLIFTGVLVFKKLMHFNAGNFILKLFDTEGHQPTNDA